LAEWRAGRLPSADRDPVRAAVEGGTFRLPQPGVDENGISWRRVEPGPSGGLGGDIGPGIGYAAARFVEDRPRRIIARADRTLGIYLNGFLQPGDFYGSRRMRVPLTSQAGENLLVVRIFGGRGESEVELWTTPDELVFNAADLTAPDLVVGDRSLQHLGVAVLNFTNAPAFEVRARVLPSEHFEETVLTYPALPAGAVTQVGFLLRPRAAWATAGQTIPVRLRLEPPTLAWSYERLIELQTVSAEAAFRRTFRSAIDGSVQYYGVVPPAALDATRTYGLVLALHGASVEAIDLARAYSRKDWAYIVTPTNRRPFGFDWEEWGRLDGLEVLDHALQSFRIDPTRVYLTGHSMGGHGTWHLGVMNPGRFAVIGPSSGWSSFYSYTGEAAPQGPFARSQAHSATMNYLGNLARRGVYILHGSADDNVPVTESRMMAEAVGRVTSDLVYHEEPDAGHWWDGDLAPGVDCVDWPPLFEFMQAHTLDPYELDFTFVSPTPSYSARHSFLTLRSAGTPYRDLRVTSERVGATVVVSTDNVRSLEVDGRALRSRGITELVVDGTAHAIPEGPLVVGPEDGKRPGVHGPYNEVFFRPFCFVYPDDGAIFADYAAYLTSYWAIIGRGHACAVPHSKLTAPLRANYNPVYLGLPPEALGAPALPFAWDDSGIRFRGEPQQGSVLLFVFPQGERLAAALVASPGYERLLFRVVPFSSGSGLPDYLIWSEDGVRAAGFFDPSWRFEPALGIP
jgi:hypothetical protein